MDTNNYRNRLQELDQQKEAIVHDILRSDLFHENKVRLLEEFDYANVFGKSFVQDELEAFKKAVVTGDFEEGHRLYQYLKSVIPYHMSRDHDWIDTFYKALGACENPFLAYRTYLTELDRRKRYIIHAILRSKLPKSDRDRLVKQFDFGEKFVREFTAPMQKAMKEAMVADDREEFNRLYFIAKQLFPDFLTHQHEFLGINYAVMNGDD